MKEFPNTRFERLLEKRAADGWRYAGREPLARDTFFDKARFIPRVFQTESDVRRKYGGENIEVDLVSALNSKLEELVQKGLTTGDEAVTVEIPNEEKVFHVFVRERQDG